MHALIKRGIGAAPPCLPKGLAFEIADLILVKGWANCHDFIMEVRLDHGTEDEEYEEIIAIHAGMSRFCRLIMWRKVQAVFVQPLPGRRQRYASVADALESQLVKQRVKLTDIVAAAWPPDGQTIHPSGLIAVGFDCATASRHSAISGYRGFNGGTAVL